MRRRFLVPVLVALLGLGFSQAGDKHFTIEDALSVKSVGGLEWSPDGSHVFFTIQEWNREKNGYRSHIYQVGRDGGEVVQLTRGERGESRFAVSPDGRSMAFLVSRDEEGGNQIWILPLDRGEAYQLTHEKNGVSSFSWSPDSAHLAFTTRDARPDQEEWDKKKEDKNDAIDVDADLQWTHLWRIKVADHETIRLTNGDFNVADSSWSPNGREIAFVASYVPAQESSWKHIDDNREADLMLVSANGGTTQSLSPRVSRVSGPEWSPDGKRLLFRETEDAMVWPSISNLMVLDLGSRQARNLTVDNPDGIGSAVWSKDGQNIFYSQGKSVYTHIYRIGAAGDSAQQVTSGEGVAGSFAMSKDGLQFTYSANELNKANDVWISRVDGSGAKRLTDVNPQINDFAVAETRPARWKATDGWDIEGVLTLPLGYRPGTRVPMILQIHGGPYGRFSHGFNARNQIFAANGYAILQPNPRGSTGYGFDFTNANVEDWGGKDFHNDDLAGVDYVVSEGIADPDRLVVMGGSYGGFSTFWAVTQTDRFKSAIGHAGISDWYSFHGQSDIPRLMEYGFGGSPWDAAETYRKWSPITHVENVKTPIMITHGEQDQRVPIAQAEQYYTSLKKLGVDVKFVRFPREGHGIREPNHVIDLVHRQLAWFDHHLGIQRDKNPVEEQN